MSQLWPWVKVTKRSSSAFSQTFTFFVPNIYGLAQTVLTWEAKVFAAAAVDTDAAVETNWKHKVTPDWGDLISGFPSLGASNVELWCLFVVNLNKLSKKQSDCSLHSDGKWRHRSGSTLLQVMACCLMAASHFLTQCWFINSKVHYHSSEGNFTRNTSAINYKNKWFDGTLTCEITPVTIW